MITKNTTRKVHEQFLLRREEERLLMWVQFKSPVVLNSLEWKQINPTMSSTTNQAYMVMYLRLFGKKMGKNIEKIVFV
jgi:hypothetical protein